MRIADVIASGRVRTVFQPIVDLDAGQVVAYEALSRGPEGALERPDLLFAAAREHDLLAGLDALCRASALRNAIDLGWPGELALFVNVEPEVLDVEALDTLIELCSRACASFGTPDGASPWTTSAPTTCPWPSCRCSSPTWSSST